MNQHDMTRNMVLAALFAALTAIGAFLQTVSYTHLTLPTTERV